MDISMYKRLDMGGAMEMGIGGIDGQRGGLAWVAWFDPYGLLCVFGLLRARRWIHSGS
jgi:hypothetical protein